MTEADRKIMNEMLSGAIKHHSEIVAEQLKGSFLAIELKLDAIKRETNLKLDAIKSDTAKTNGKVAAHEVAIRLLEQGENNHILKCPQTKEIADIRHQVATMEKLWVANKAVKSFTWKQAGFGAIIIGIIISLIQLLIK